MSIIFTTSVGIFLPLGTFWSISGFKLVKNCILPQFQCTLVQFGTKKVLFAFAYFEFDFGLIYPPKVQICNSLGPLSNI